jgi:hypothetical protein
MLLAHEPIGSGAAQQPPLWALRTNVKVYMD